MIFVSVLLKFAFSVFVTGGADAAVLVEQQLENRFSYCSNLVGFGLHDHSGRNLERAGGDGAYLAIDLDQAQPAGTCWNQSRVVAQIRDVDAVVGG